jgi:hypothetical protein
MFAAISPGAKLDALQRAPQGCAPGRARIKTPPRPAFAGMTDSDVFSDFFSNLLTGFTRLKQDYQDFYSSIFLILSIFNPVNPDESC